MARKTTTRNSGDQLPSAVAFERLLAAIQEGDLPSGTRLREVDLATQFNLSRTPVRDALKRLESQGLVSHVPYRGTSVTKYDYNEINELFAMRAVLEGTAAGMAATQATPLEIEQLQEMVAHDRVLITQAQQQGEEMPLTLLTTNKDFHRLIHLAARNRFLVSMIEALWTSMALIQNRRISKPRGMPSLKEHAEIVRCIAARDPARAEAAARAHVQAVMKNRLTNLRNE